MKVTRASSDSRRGPAEWFTGEVWLREVAASPPPSRLTVVDVRFAAGARTAWHTHPLGQVIHVTHGDGLAQREGGPVVRLRPGDTAHFAPGEVHWHGAAPEGPMTHLAMHESDDDGVGTRWGEPVTEEAYGMTPEEV